QVAPMSIWSGAARVAISGALVDRIDSTDAPMPPRFPLDDWQIETIQRWGRAEPVVRGEPRPGNQRPVLELREVGRDVTTVTLAYDLHDPDGDLVVGQLCDDDGGGTCVF